MGKRARVEVYHVEGQAFPKGCRVSIRVSFHGGPPRVVEGELITVVRGLAYVETAFGAVDGPASTLDRLE